MSNSLPLLLEPEHLHSLLTSGDSEQQLLLVAVCQRRMFQQVHIPQSRLVEPAELVSGIPPATGKLPDKAQLERVFSRLGLRPDHHIIAYDDEGGGWAGRLLWTLDVIGHDQYSLLDGGLVAWAGLGFPVASGDDTQSSNTPVSVQINDSYRVSKEQILQQLGDPKLGIWDARTAEEYRGEKLTAQKNGHIPGAANLDWLELMDRDNHLRLKPLADIQRQLEALGLTPEKEIITHCQSHHRSGLSYIVGKMLGLKIKAYDGSWSEWGNDPDTPVEN